jgi:hypothetical protein
MRWRMLYIYIYIYIYDPGPWGCMHVYRTCTCTVRTYRQGHIYIIDDHEIPFISFCMTWNLRSKWVTGKRTKMRWRIQKYWGPIFEINALSDFPLARNSNLIIFMHAFFHGQQYFHYGKSKEGSIWRWR